MYRLNQFGFLGVSGIEAVKFLQGYTTCDLEKLADMAVQPGAVCTLKGRMLSSFLVLRCGNDLILRMDRALVTVTADFLGKYIVFSKAELIDLSDSLTCYGEICACDMYAVSGTQGGHAISLGNRRELWLPAATEIEASPADSTWTDAELEQDMVWVTSETSEEYLPQMLGYHNLGAVDFGKGCYLGQEIVARAQYRGELKRKLHRIPLAPEESPEDISLVARGSDVGMAVLSNAGTDPIEVSLAGGETRTAVPVV